MKTEIKKLGLILLVSSMLAVSSSTLFAGLGPLVDIPINAGETTPPMTMLVLSNDHQLYYKAYSDISDLDSDGNLDTTFKNTIRYSGYFDPNQCYSYNSTKKIYVPQGAATNYQCNLNTKGDWSGNFLNWATMSRIDVLRYTLYGGQRITDTTASTVLGRAAIPRDNHSFVKIYASADVNKYTPYTDNPLSICNSSPDHASGNIYKPGTPTMRFAKGNADNTVVGWPYWSATERTQCSWEGGGGNPDSLTGAGTNNDDTNPTYADTSERLGENRVYVEVCSDEYSQANDSRCRAYTDNSTGVVTYKPAGLLQVNGESGDVRFGLITGSYNANGSGGVLRSQMKTIVGNFKTDDKGTVDIADDTVVSDDSNNEINLDNGIFNTLVTNGIISSIDAFTIADFNYDTNKYRDCSGAARHSFSNGQCRDFGNPISEMYLEALRYIGGDQSATPPLGGPLAPNPNSNADDSSLFPELTKIQAWIDPYVASPCSDCNIIVISTGINSFDGGGLAKASDLRGITNLAALQTDYLDSGLLGVFKNEFGGGITAFIGEASGNSNKTCDAKSITNFSSLKGICPEVPSQGGSYNIAGLANYAKNNDMRGDITGKQVVTTYAVSLAESLPSFDINVGGSVVSFVPTCQSNTTTNNTVNLATTTNWGDCALVNIITESATPTAGSFVSVWEDASFGNDFDADVSVRLEYCVGPTAAGCNDVTVASNQMKITMNGISESTNIRMKFGYAISGVGSDDGAIQGLIMNDTGTSRFAYWNDSRIQTPGYGPWDEVYTASSSGGATKLENPLWYAAKYGGFIDSDGDGVPNTSSINANLNAEWDAYDLDGNRVIGGDGIPDNYFPVRNPDQLGKSLGRVFAQATESKSSTAASFSSGRFTTETLVFLSEFDTNTWSGDLKAFSLTDAGVSSSNAPVWSAADKLRAQALDTTNRNILTFNNNDDGIAATTDVGAGVVFEFPPATVLDYSDVNDAAALKAALDFDPASSDPKYIGANLVTSLLGGLPAGVVDPNTLPSDVVDTATLNAYGVDLVNYLRGDTDNEFGIAGGRELFRSREVDTDNNPATDNNQFNILGALVHSPPVFMGEPSELYPNNIEAIAYNTYKDTLAASPVVNRDGVVFVGSNDGMMHAFNSSVTTTGSGANTVVIAGTDAGKEEFAYIPSYLSNNLSDLADADSSSFRQAYTDGSITVRDVFVGGKWQTYLVGSTRTGGRGLYILNVTDPENMLPTDVLAEFQHKDLGLTFSKALIIKTNAGRTAGSGGRWAAIFGNGYNNTGDGTAKLFILFLDDLADGITEGDDYRIIETGQGNITDACDAVGNQCNGLSSPTIADLNGDFIVDRVYAGDIQGNMWAFDLSDTNNNGTNWVVSGSQNPPVPLFTACDGSCVNNNGIPINRLPITTAPQIQSHPGRKSNSTAPNVLVYFGTGQFIAKDAEDDITTQTFHGVWDHGQSTTIAKTQLQEQIFKDVGGDIRISPDASVADQVAAYDAINGIELGWYIDFKFSDTAIKRFEGGRSIVDSILLGEIIFFNINVPEIEQELSCVPGGSSYLVALDAYDGSEPAFTVFFGVDENGNEVPVNTYVKESKSSTVGSGSGITSTGDISFTETNVDSEVDSNKVNVNSLIEPGRTSWSILR